MGEGKKKNQTFTNKSRSKTLLNRTANPKINNSKANTWAKYGTSIPFTCILIPIIINEMEKRTHTILLYETEMTHNVQAQTGKSSCEAFLLLTTS